MLHYEPVLPVTGSVRRTLLMMHGLGDSIRGWSFLPQMLRLPDLGFILVQAPIQYYGGWSWYDFENPARGAQDIRRSREMLGELIAHLALDPSRTILGGFSQGGVMALEYGLRSDAAWAGILSVSGYVPLLAEYPEAFGSAIARQRVLATHGPRDPVLPYEHVKPQLEELVRAGAPVVFETYDKAHDLDVDDELPRIRSWIAEGMQAD